LKIVSKPYVRRSAVFVIFKIRKGVNGFYLRFMKTKNKRFKSEYSQKNKELIELAALRLAEIFISQIEFNKNTNSNKYEIKSNSK